MKELKFKDLAFNELEDTIEVIFLKLFHFYISKKALGKCIVKEHSIELKDDKKFYNLLDIGFENMANRINGKKAVYIHKNSGIPLIGNIAFGIVDRNTNIIELRPISACNLNCIYCSVDAAKRKTEFVVEKDYLTEEFKKIVEYKGDNDIEAHINCQGEPLLYADIVELIRDINKIKNVKTISIDTNGTMLTQNFADRLIDAGLTRFNISVNAMDNILCRKIAGANAYDIDKIMDICRHIAKKADLIIAPVWLKGINDDEISKLIEFSKTLKTSHKVIMGVQNFLYYRLGKNPVKQQSWNKFKEMLKKLEKKHSVKLLLDFKKDFNVHPTKPLPKMFRKNQIIEAKIVSHGQLDNEFIAVSNERAISVFSRCIVGKTYKLKIIRTKHNIYTAKIL